eukprot:403376674
MSNFNMCIELGVFKSDLQKIHKKNMESLSLLFLQNTMQRKGVHYLNRIQYLMSNFNMCIELGVFKSDLQKIHKKNMESLSLLFLQNTMQRKGVHCLSDTLTVELKSYRPQQQNPIFYVKFQYVHWIGCFQKCPLNNAQKEYGISFTSIPMKHDVTKRNLNNRIQYLMSNFNMCIELGVFKSDLQKIHKKNMESLSLLFLQNTMQRKGVHCLSDTLTVELKSYRPQQNPIFYVKFQYVH